MWLAFCLLITFWTDYIFHRYNFVCMNSIWSIVDGCDEILSYIYHLKVEMVALFINIYIIYIYICMVGLNLFETYIPLVSFKI